MRQTSLTRLYEAHRDSLSLVHVSGPIGARLSVAEERIWPADLVGHLNLIHPTRLQVLGAAELAWAQRQANEKVAHHLNEILSAHPPAIIVADGCEIPNILHGICEAHDVALFTARHPSASVIDQLRLYLSRELAEKVSLHGVFMDVLGLGVMITGDSGAGKSELGLELLSRGHGLVADDVVEFSRIAPSVLEGRCPPLLQDVMEVRGLGILNIRTVFGETAIRPKKILKLIIHLVKATDQIMQDIDRLAIQSETQEVLNVKIRKVTIPVAAGRNLGVLVETAVRNYILQLRGIDSTRDFIERQTRMLREQENAADPD